MSRVIRLLPPELANQIAAGEVVERPASVVKELLENSLDAGARRLRVDLARGGQGLIRVQDDGAGMAPEDLPLAVLRHATSKVESAADLFAIRTFGFRGEALASVASVARLSLRSTARGAHEGALLELAFGRETGRGPAPGSPGTTVEVRDLFENTPARLKFLKSEATELKRCLEVVHRLALAHLDVGFVVQVDGRPVARFAPGQTLAARLATLWPPAVCEEMMPFQGRLDELSVHGLAGRPSKAQLRADRLLFFVAGRPVQDRLLLSAVRQAYKGRLLAREYPQVVLFLDLPAEEIDVNVHPAKSEVRFRDEGRVMALIIRALGQALESEPGLAYPEAVAQAPAPRFRETGSVPYGGLASPPSGPAQDEELAPAKAQRYREFTRQSAEQARLDLPPGPSRPARTTSDVPLVPLASTASGSSDVPVYLGQVHATYLVLAMADGSLGLLDQHAAHERILYDQLRRQGSRGDSRPLAVPLELPLHPSEAEGLAQGAEALAALGFVLSRHSGGVTLSGVPPQLSPAAATELLRDVLAGGAEGLDDLWAMMACRQALKAGDTLAPAEALALVEAWRGLPDRNHCPHGRPVFLSLSPAELERMFKRRV